MKQGGYKFTPKQKKFIEFYNGNATEAAKKAGYSEKTAGVIGNENLKKPEIAAAIKAREEITSKNGIKTREERQKFWSDIMDNPEEDMRNRLQASKLLGQSQIDFTEKRVTELTGALVLDSVTERLAGALRAAKKSKTYKNDEKLEDKLSLALEKKNMPDRKMAVDPEIARKIRAEQENEESNNKDAVG